MYNSMVYSEATRKATLKYRQKNIERTRELCKKNIKDYRNKWATFFTETKSFRAIDYS